MEWNVERRRSESNRRIEVLQTSALPLGYGAEASKVTKTDHFLNPPETNAVPSNRLGAFLGATRMANRLLAPADALTAYDTEAYGKGF